MKKLLLNVRTTSPARKGYIVGALLAAVAVTGMSACTSTDEADRTAPSVEGASPSAEAPSHDALADLGDAPLSPSRFITVNGISLAVYESKGHLKPSVLFLHGNTASANMFARVFRSPIAKVFRFVAIDLPGYGRSGNAGAYNAQLFRSTIAGAASQLGVDDGVIAGFSLGGDFTLQSIAALPKIKGVFLTGTAPIGVTPDLPPPFLGPTESPAGPAVQFGAVPNLTPEMLVAYVTAFFRPGFASIPSFFFSDGERTDPGTRLAVFLAVTGQDPTFADEVAAIRGLQIPVALVVGEQDSFVRQAYLDALAPSIPKLFLHQIIKVPNAGHTVQWERPAAYNTLLGAFLVRVISGL